MQYSMLVFFMLTFFLISTPSGRTWAADTKKANNPKEMELKTVPGGVKVITLAKPDARRMERAQLFEKLQACLELGTPLQKKREEYAKAPYGNYMRQTANTLILLDKRKWDATHDAFMKAANDDSLEAKDKDIMNALDLFHKNAGDFIVMTLHGNQWQFGTYRDFAENPNALNKVLENPTALATYATRKIAPNRHFAVEDGKQQTGWLTANAKAQPPYIDFQPAKNVSEVGVRIEFHPEGFTLQ